MGRRNWKGAGPSAFRNYCNIKLYPRGEILQLLKSGCCSPLLPFFLPPITSTILQSGPKLAEHKPGWGGTGRGQGWIGGERVEEGRGGGRTDRSWHKALEQKASKKHYTASSFQGRNCREKIPQVTKRGIYWSYCKHLDVSLECWRCLI